MKSFKRIFFFQLKFLPLLGAIVFIIGAIVYETTKKSQEDYQLISKKEFFNKAIEKKITDFEKIDEFIYMNVAENEKYKWLTKKEIEEDQLSDSITKYYSSFSISEESSEPEKYYYLIGLYVIVMFILMILAFNLTVVLWFFCFYDLMKSEFVENHNKILWFISLIVLPFISPAFYWALASKQKRV
jgi:ATP-dependent Zn protease